MLHNRAETTKQCDSGTSKYSIWYLLSSWVLVYYLPLSDGVIVEIAGQGQQRQIGRWSIYHYTNLLPVYLCVKDNRRDSLSSAGRKKLRQATGWLALWFEGLSPV